MATEYIRNVARIVTVAVCILCCLTVNDVSGSDAEERLRYDLFHNYNATVRPAEKPGDTVVIDIALAITQILDVDEKRQVVTGNLWIYQIWTDFRLKWDPADYDGIFNLPVQSKQIWFPDTALYQSANEEHVNYPTVIALNIIGIIHNDGSVTVCTAHVYELPCVMAITTFPFDTQTCPVYFGTWVHFVQDLDFKAHFDGVERESFIANTEWEITGSEANRYEGSFLTFAGNYSYLEFLIHIERKPMYYIINLSIPCVLFSILTVLVFYLPPDSADKIPLAVSILLTLFVFNLLVADIMPASSDGMPILSLYLLMSMALVVLAVIFSAFVMKIHAATGEVHGWTRKIFIDFLPRYLFFNLPTGSKERRRVPSYEPNYVHMPGFTPRIQKQRSSDSRHEADNSMKSKDTDVFIQEGCDAAKVQHYIISTHVLKRLDMIIEELKQATNDTDGESDWKMVANVLNRLLLIVFFILFLACTMWLVT